MNIIINKIKKYYMHILFIIVAITILTTWSMFDYLDLDTLTAWSLDFWDLIFDKNLGLKDFYEYTGYNYHGAKQLYCEGSYISLLSWFIWNLPLWCVMKIIGITSVNNIFVLYWSKLHLVLIHCGIAYLVYGISKKLECKNGCIAALLVLGAPEIIISSCYAVQDEVVYVFTFLVAISLMISNKWKVAYVFCVLTVTLCPIMILPVTVLVLYKEKIWYRIVVYEILLLVPTLIFEMLYAHDHIYQTVKVKHSLSTYGYEMIENMSLSTGIGEISVCVVLCILVFFWCYVEKGDDNKRLIVALAIIMVIANFGMSNIFYRQFLYVPFLVLLITYGEVNVDLNIFMYTIFTYVRVLRGLWVNELQNMNIVWVMKNSWVTKLCDYMGGQKRKYLEDHYLIHYFRGNQYEDLIKLISGSVSLACVMILIYINFFKNQRYRSPIQYKYSLCMYVLCMPLLLIGCWGMLLI